MSGDEAVHYTVIYDGQCGICTRLAARLGTLDSRSVFEIVPSQRADIRARYPWIPDAAYAAALQVVRDADGRTWQGASAVEQVISELRDGWLLAWLFHIPFARPVAERLYGWFARHRNRLGCGEHCAV